jgi:hypothetical protein
MSNTTTVSTNQPSSCVEKCQQVGCDQTPCQQCCVDAHKVDYCTFWGMVYEFPYIPSPSIFTCSAVQDPTVDIPPGMPMTSVQMQELIGILPNALDCNYYSVFMFYPNNPVDPTTNQDIKVHPFLTAESSDKPAVFENSYIFNESIPLIQGLINEYPTGTFFFYKAMYTDPNTGESSPNVTFYVSQVGKENYYCDVTILFP